MSKGIIPMVDLEGVGVGSAYNDEKIKRAAEQVHEAFSTIGFVYLLNHGIPDSQIQEARAKADQFFCLPDDVKTQYIRKKDNDFGWVPPEMEMLNPERGIGDYKECFNACLNNRILWPQKEVPGFDQSMMDLILNCEQLSTIVLNLMAIGLKLENPKFFSENHNYRMKGNATTLRCLYYPPLPDSMELKPQQVRCGEHSDYGSITLLFQDGVEGLEVMNRDGIYQAAVPVEGAVLVNIGDLMQRWTSDQLVSTKHRVLVPESEALKKSARRSMAFFVHPDGNCLIQCLDGTDKYPAISAGDYLLERFGVTY